MLRLRNGGLLAVFALAGACSRPGGPFEVTQNDFPLADAGTTQIAVMTPPGVCTPAKSSQMIPPRSSVTSQSGQTDNQANVELTSDLYNLFKSVCGGCHVESNLGNFQVTPSTFPMQVTSAVYAIITSDDPNVFMPPPASGGVPFSQRSSSDAEFVLAQQLMAWLAQGSPVGSFTLQTQAATASVGYAIKPALGKQLTNIGSCIPNQAMVGTDGTAMDQLDATFAAATSLPTTLDQTDLTTLDSATLAQNGVISYAPTYPLWSDNAQKMRYVRVPHGQSIVFNKTTQTFNIPANTRFYKTFLKQVKDVSGNQTYRKVETRVIVSRPDTTNADGSAQQNALFGTYVWNDDESQATLLNDPLRDGKPFADRIFEYVTDDKAAQPIIASKPANLQAALDNAHITRHYALPGAERCTQCHEGSPSQSFILGFTPLQVARRPNNQGGVYEEATGDELTQLQRLIDYGVITGVASPSDILPLEESEGNRTPRNDYELKAQAYMIGNCAHCHNPRGYPSIRQPELKDALIFLPGTGPNQGIFQFPLSALSPIRTRSVTQNVPIPYITPSLYDLPVGIATPKYMCPSDVANEGQCSPSDTDETWILAPWRSLIYRNTDSPYDYFDDSAAFPHMPLNTSGYDCRVAGIMGDWMVSIPARRKDQTKVEGLFPVSGQYPDNSDDDPQPYEEVFPGDSDFNAAEGARDARLAEYHTGLRYGFCPDSYTADIVDKYIASEVDANIVVTEDTGLGFPDPNNPNRYIMPANFLPISPNYVSFDDTDPPGPWFPRRPDWNTALVNPNIPAYIQAATLADALTPDQAEDLTNVVTALGGVTLASERAELTQPYPFGLWDTTVPGCNFNGIPTAGSYSGASRPVWMTVAQPSASAPVLVESDGAAIFTTVCFNCHGILADSKGLLADEITDLTGGDARVADFRDGLFGPTTSPGMYRDLVFGSGATTLGITTEDLGSRYMAWMALGGTQKHLPQDVLNEVAESPVVGVVRSNVELQGTPDMLRLGLNLCQQVANSDPNSRANLGKFVALGRMGWSDFSGLVDSNGDAEMWLRLCNLGNRPFVRIPSPPGGWTATTLVTDLQILPNQLYWAQGPNGEDWYGANPVMDQNGNVQMGVTTTGATPNLFPMCVAQPSDAQQLQWATAALQAGKVMKTNAIPFCPSGFVQASHALAMKTAQQTTTGEADYVDARKWAARGAINAALAVFLYLEEIEADPSKRQPLYTQCNLINSSTP